MAKTDGQVLNLVRQHEGHEFDSQIGSDGLYAFVVSVWNLEQVANLQCAQVNSASYPLRDGKWVVAFRL